MPRANDDDFERSLADRWADACVPLLRSSDMIANNKSANRDAERTFVADRDKALTVSGCVVPRARCCPLADGFFLRPASRGSE
jgi:hypothetical protein